MMHYLYGVITVLIIIFILFRVLDYFSLFEEFIEEAGYDGYAVLTFHIFLISILSWASVFLILYKFSQD